MPLSVNVPNEHAEVLKRATRGDDEALSALVVLYHDRVYRFGMRVCRDGYDADDAVQEAFVKLSVRPDVIADPTSLAWLYKVVRNACLRLLRPFLSERRALGVRAEEDQLPSDEVQPDAALERWDLVRAVHAAIAELDEPYREVLVLRDLEGLTGDETCAALGLEPAAMKTRLHRARMMLRTKVVRLRVVA